jgi:hypothetical protein
MQVNTLNPEKVKTLFNKGEELYKSGSIIECKKNY